MIGRVLCWLGWHAYGYIGWTYGMMYACTRCGYRPGRDN